MTLFLIEDGETMIDNGLSLSLSLSLTSTRPLALTLTLTLTLSLIKDGRTTAEGVSGRNLEK